MIELKTKEQKFEFLKTNWGKKMEFSRYSDHRLEWVTGILEGIAYEDCNLPFQADVDSGEVETFSCARVIVR